MSSRQRSTGRPLAVTGVMYLVQLGVAFSVVFHDFSSKDIAIVASLLIAVYGMSTAQTAFEGAISGMHFSTVFRLLMRSKDVEATNGDVELNEVTEKDTPFTFAHGLFGLLIALIGVAKLVYTLIS